MDKEKSTIEYEKALKEVCEYKKAQKGLSIIRRRN